MPEPLIIQGGMGAAVSDWRLARTVSQLGQLGVVSGTAIAVVLARRLQCGDTDGQMRRALARFPKPGVAERIISRYFIAGGKNASEAFQAVPMPTVIPPEILVDLMVAGAFAEVFLAKEGHGGLVGINLLEKIQLPTLPTLFGAMLAGVDYVLMGAGIPRTIPGVLDRLAQGEIAELALDVAGMNGDGPILSTFDPKPYLTESPAALRRPQFLAIVSSATLAIALAKKSNGRVDGFVVEGETAGGHNAPPRGTPPLSESGEPVYGPRDVPDLEKIRALGLPFWLAGSFGRAGKLAEARQLGAAGIQVGTAFAFCEESGIRPDLKLQALKLSREGRARIFTDPLASPTGFPFKVAQLDDTLSDTGAFEDRSRTCDLGYLRHLYRKEDGGIGYRCPAEPGEDFAGKGGALGDSTGRKCVCNGLVATIGMGQTRASGKTELALVTAGDDFGNIAQFLKPGAASYSAAEVLEKLLQPAKA
jgi:NAD(P)H-dependent flavin oxidoreductase YrpB (nitropropane dioxygenase family)